MYNDARSFLPHPERILDFADLSLHREGCRQTLITVFGAFAEFERNLMLERQREGIAKAKADGKYKGGSRRLAPKPMR
jgi:DNA invertase Pin-like site-specific DNA recombinase